MPTIVGILTFMSRINLSLAELSLKKSFITSGPGSESEEDKKKAMMAKVNWKTVDSSQVLYKSKPVEGWETIGKMISEQINVP